MLSIGARMSAWRQGPSLLATDQIRFGHVHEAGAIRPWPVNSTKLRVGLRSEELEAVKDGKVLKHEPRVLSILFFTVSYVLSIWFGKSE